MTDKKKMSIGWKLYFVFAYFFFAIVLVYYIDVFVFNYKHVNKIISGSNCYYKTPNGYKIVYNEQEKQYAVAVLTYGDYYLYRNSHGITTMFSSIAKPSIFDDSCQAKAFLKTYIESISPTLKNYK